MDLNIPTTNRDAGCVVNSTPGRKGQLFCFFNILKKRLKGAPYNPLVTNQYQGFKVTTLSPDLMLGEPVLNLGCWRR